MTQSIERAIKLLDNLSFTQFKTVLLYYQVPKSEIPDAGARGDKSIAVVEYALQKEGKQLTELFEVIDKVMTQKNEVVSKKKDQINIDTLRFHLANRREQETKLGRAIHTHHNKHRPLVCLIHSDETQCSDRFVERLAKHYIPKVVARDNIRSHYVPCNFKEHNDLQQEISEQLASKLGLNPFATDTEIVNAIVRERSPIIFSIDMCTNNWSLCGEIQLIHNFIDFWAKLKIPESHNHLLLICLYFNYTDLIPINFWNFFKKRSINNKIRKEFIRLENENFYEKFGINGVVLPELINIERQDVLAWAREHLHGNVLDMVQPKINNLYSDCETISMQDLVTKLREIFEDFPLGVFKF